MKQKHVVILILITAILCSAIGSAATAMVLKAHPGTSRTELSNDLSDGKLERIWSMVEANYYRDADAKTAYDLALDYACYGLIASLDDPYSEYLTAEEADDLMEGLSGTYYGIGVTISYDKETGYVKVVARPFHGSPAADAGILSGDCLLQVDDIIITQDSMDEAVTYMRTPKEDGKPLHLIWLRDGEQMSADIMPSTVQMESVTYAEYQDIAYIRISSFDYGTTNDFADALSSIDQSRIKGLVLDLRDNPGGIMGTSAEICDLLLPEGTVVYTKDKAGHQETYSSDDSYFDIPMVVLVNGGSASAAEITAGALQAHKRAAIIGEQTYGKGVVQGVYPLPDGSMIKLTCARYYTPADVCIDGVGITPDVEVSLPEDTPSFDPTKFDLTVDTQMAKAIEMLRK